MRWRRRLWTDAAITPMPPKRIYWNDYVATRSFTGTVRRVLMEQPRPFDVDAAEAALASNKTETVAGGP